MPVSIFTVVSDPLDADGSTSFVTIQEAVTAASDGDRVEIGAGTFVLPDQLTVNKSITLAGAGEGATIIDASGVTNAYGISSSGAAADGIAFEGFTLYGPANAVGTAYGLKLSGIDGVSVTNVTVQGSGRTEVDLNNVQNAVLTNVTANGAAVADGTPTGGNGFSLTNSSNITLDGIATDGLNAWGGIALYPTTGDITGISFQNGFDVQEGAALFLQEKNGFTATLDDFPFGEVWEVSNDSFRLPGTDSPQYTFLFGSKTDATDFAAGLASPDRSVVTDPDGVIQVSGGMSLQAAIDAAEAGDTIQVGDGVYDNIAIDKALTLQAINEGGAVINGPGVSQGAAVVIEAGVSDVTLSGFDINAAAGDLAGVFTRGDNTNVTLSDNDIDGGAGAHAVLAGVANGTGLTDATLSGNAFSSAAAQAVVYINGAASIGGASASGNIIDGNSFTGGPSGGLLLGVESSDGAITGNTFAGTAGYAQLELFGAGNAITGNDFGADGTPVIDGTAGYDGAAIAAGNTFFGPTVTVDGSVYTSLQAAVNAAGDGATLVIGAGDFSAEGKITITDKSLIIEGNLAGISPTGDNWDGQTGETVITGFEMRGTAGLDLDGVRLMGVIPGTGSGLAGISKVSSGDLTVRNSVIEGDGSDEAALTYSPAGLNISRNDGDITVDNVLFTDFVPPSDPGASYSSEYPYAIYLNYGDSVTDRNVSITNSRFDFTNEDGFDFPTAIASDGRTGNEGTFIVSGNTFEGTGPRAAIGHFDVSGKISGPVDFSDVSDNTFIDAIGASANTGVIDNRSGFEVRAGANIIDGVTYDAVIADVTVPSDAEITGTPGDDFISGDDGMDTVVYNGNLADYAVTVTADNSISVSGPEGNDMLLSVERIQFADGYYVIEDGALQAFLTGTSGNDVLTGTEGDDIFVAGAGNDAIDARGGSDTYDMERAEFSGGFADLQSGLAFSTRTGLDRLSNIENVSGSAGDDAIFGDDGDNVFFASGGIDDIDGRGGNDTYDASQPVEGFADVSDEIELGPLGMDDDGGPAQDVLVNLRDGTVDRNGENAGTLANIENVITGAGDDVVIGNEGVNRISTGAGDDFIVTGGGNDMVDAGAGDDTVVFLHDRADYTITWDGTTATVANGTDSVTVTNAGRLSFLNSDVYLVAPGSDEFATVQSAVNEAGDGDEIILAAGTYGENVNLTASVTITGANAGLAHDDAGRSAESVVQGVIDVAVDGVTIDGITVQDGGTALGQSAGIYVRGDDLSVANSVLTQTGTAGASRGILTETGSGNGLTVTGSAFSGWATGVFANAGGAAEVTVTGNSFDGNTVGLSIDGPAGGDVSGNSFANSGFEHIGIGVLPTQDTVDVSETVGANTFDDSQQPVTIYALGDSQQINGTVNDDHFVGTYGGGFNTLAGGEGNDSYQGGAGSEFMLVDTDDTDIDGGDGDDVAVFAPGTAVADVLAMEDEFSNVELIAITGNDTFGPGSSPALPSTFVVFEGMSIQVAVNSASPGDTIQLAAGSFAEDVIIPDGIILLGANAGMSGTEDRSAESLIEGRITIAGDGVIIDGVAFDIDASGAGNGQGVVTMDGANGTLTGAVMVQDADLGVIPFAVRINGEGNTVSDTLIDRDGASGSGSIGNPAISVDGADAVSLTGNTLVQGIIGIVTGDGTSDQVGLTLTGNTITAPATNTESILVTGPGIGALPAGFAPLADTIDLTGNTFTTDAGLRVRGTNGADDLSSFATAGIDVLIGNGGNDTFVGSAGQDALNGGQGMGDTVSYANATNPVYVNLQGQIAYGTDIDSDRLISIENIIGGSGNDAIYGNVFGNVLTGGAGNDQLFGAAGNDTFIIGDGDNTISGGTGDDTAELTGNWADYTITATGPDSFTLADGTFTNTVTGVESFAFGDVTLDAIDLLNVAPDSLTFVIAAPEVDENSEGAIVTPLAATDPNTGDTLTFSVDDARFVISDVSGVPTLRLAAGVSLDRNDGAVTVNVTVTDAQGLSRTEALSVGVNNVNLAPGGGAPLATWAPNAVQAGSIGALLAPDANVTDPDGDTLSYTLTTAPLAGALLLANASLDYSSPAALAASLDAAALTAGTVLTEAQFASMVYRAPDAAGEYSAQFSVSDGEFSDPLSLSLTVNAGTDDVLVGDGIVLDGAAGNDDLRGGAGSDTVIGGSGDDIMRGGGGDDTLFGGEGDDVIAVNGGNDLVYGGAGNDEVFATNGNNIVYGGSGDDILRGGSGDNLMRGGSGDNLMRGGSGNDIMDGGTGNATLAGNDDDDVLSAGSGNNRLFGGSGNDTLNGGTGNDILNGGYGTDVLNGGAGADMFVFRAVSDSYHGAGRDTINNFENGVDKIDLSQIMPGISFVGTGGLELYTGVAGQVRYNDAIGRLYLDSDGDGASDFSVDLTGAPTLTVDDFIF